MTPFGEKVRHLRREHGAALKDMARALKVSSAYLSAMEHGHRGKPSAGLVQQVAAYFNLAWDQVDELRALAEISDPKVTIDTAGMSSLATEAANLLAKRIAILDTETLNRMLLILRDRTGR